jgi:hypothetical protein
MCVVPELFELDYYGLKIGRHKPSRYSKKLWDSFILNQRLELEAELQWFTLFWVLSLELNIFISIFTDEHYFFNFFFLHYSL